MLTIIGLNLSIRISTYQFDYMINLCAPVKISENASGDSEQLLFLISSRGLLIADWSVRTFRTNPRMPVMSCLRHKSDMPPYQEYDRNAVSDILLFDGTSILSQPGHSPSNDARRSVDD